MRKIALVFLVLLSYTFSGCVFGKLTFSDGKNWVPKDFHPKTEILLIESFPTDIHFNKDMTNYLKKNYRGQYEVVENEMILNKTGKYADIIQYQFAFLWETRIMNNSVTNQDTKPIGHFFDRSIKKDYPHTKKRNRYKYKNAFKSYIDTIDLFFKK